MANKFTNRKPTAAESEEAFAFWHGRFRSHRRAGMRRREAKAAANADAEKKYGKVDWAALLQMLLPIILKLLGL